MTSLSSKMSIDTRWLGREEGLKRNVKKGPSISNRKKMSKNVNTSSSEICLKEPERKGKRKKREQSPVRVIAKFVQEDKVWRLTSLLQSAIKTVRKALRKLSQPVKKSQAKRKIVSPSLEVKLPARTDSLRGKSAATWINLIDTILFFIEYMA
jgi:hypothetical protein